MVDDTPNAQLPNFGKPNFPHVTCHNGPKLTNAQTVDVGTGAPFQVPSLVGVGCVGAGVSAYDELHAVERATRARATCVRRTFMPVHTDGGDERSQARGPRSFLTIRF